MSERRGSYVIRCAVVLLLIVGCHGGSHDSPPEDEGVVFKNSSTACHTAAVNALTVLGFDVKKDEPDYVEGVRPRHMNLIWGAAGGERVMIWLVPVDEARTRVVVDTDRSFVGLVGQKHWDEDVTRQMTASLSR
jgi:hypothetical protein